MPWRRSASLLSAVVRHPAMLVWLDADSNRRGHANENLARELMELFTLGIGHYSEADVQGRGPAPDRLGVASKTFRFDSAIATTRMRYILCWASGNDWTATNCCASCSNIRRILRGLAAKLCGLFFGEAVVSDASDGLAGG